MDGILILNKEQNMTSNRAIMEIKKILKIEKIGHCGTLDPDATGVLPVLLNKACKLSDFFVDKEKEYIATGIFGIKTDTADISGSILEEKEYDAISKEQLEKSIQSFLGVYHQIPPMYSAIKKNGKKLYELARKNIQIELEERVCQIYEIELLDFYTLEGKTYFAIRVKCAKGLYVRTLIEDICLKTGNIGTLFELKRTKSGNFSIENSSTLSEIREQKFEIIPLSIFFSEYEKIEVSPYLKKLIQNGIILDERQIRTNKIFQVYHQNELIAIYKPFDEYQYKPLVIL